MTFDTIEQLTWTALMAVILFTFTIAVDLDRRPAPRHRAIPAERVQP